MFVIPVSRLLAGQRLLFFIARFRVPVSFILFLTAGQDYFSFIAGVCMPVGRYIVQSAGQLAVFVIAEFIMFVVIYAFCVSADRFPVLVETLVLVFVLFEAADKFPGGLGNRF